MNQQRWIKWINKVLRSCDTMPVKKDVGNCNDVDKDACTVYTSVEMRVLKESACNSNICCFALKETVSRDKGVCILSQRTLKKTLNHIWILNSFMYTKSPSGTSYGLYFAIEEYCSGDSYECLWLADRTVLSADQPFLGIIICSESLATVLSADSRTVHGHRG